MTRYLNIRSILLVAVVSTCACLVSAQSKEDDPTKGMDMAGMMERVKNITQPSKHHKLLERFLGEWETATSIHMGSQASPPEAGSAKFTWLMEGRWLKSEYEGTLMGMPHNGFMIMGYDNFKMSYVVTSVSSMDTAMLRSEGDLDPGGKALITYGTLDEYLTGEHDKMVKYVWRFISDDEMRLEVHDLPIGEKNTKVVEITYTRKQ